MEVPKDQLLRVTAVREWVVSRVRDFRNAKGWTQTDLADRMSVHYTRICDLEANRSDYKASTIFRACAAMGVPMEKFFKGCPGWKGRAAQTDDTVVFSGSDLKKLLCDQGYDPKDVDATIQSLNGIGE